MDVRPDDPSVGLPFRENPVTFNEVFCANPIDGDTKRIFVMNFTSVLPSQAADPAPAWLRQIDS